ncbi:hypothetical protein HGRIS_004923 [Hohenbuehelia grisea]|uniref:Uncharacterized protein n=1 Tax=Hohenbuehelia grisea TaxID=104357 RepID=A0ABR3JE90_9AGAR
MSAIGSVFLGDIQRYRTLSSPANSTPPSSPPPPLSATSITNMAALTASPPLSAHPPPEPSEASLLPSPAATVGQSSSTAPVIAPPPSIDPELSLELRLRWLEAILFGIKQEAYGLRDGKGKEREMDVLQGETLVRTAQDIQRKLSSAVEGNDALKRFMDHYEQYAPLLTPSFALSGVLPESPAYSHMTPAEFDALLTEMEPDIRAAERDMREIEELERKGMTGAGRLTDYEALRPRLVQLLKANDEDSVRARALERRVARLVERNATHVDALSELFVVWDEVITDAEFKITRLLRQRDDRQRLGIE